MPYLRCLASNILVILVLAEGVLFSVVSSSIINANDEQLHSRMHEKYERISKLDISKRTAMGFGNLSNYFQGRYLSTCKSCGLINSKKQNFLIIKGDMVNPPYKYPWMVRLQGIKKIKHGKFITTLSSYCGGAIISEYYILTAAHCFKKPVDRNNPNRREFINPEDLHVHFLTTTYALKDGPKVQQIIPHPGYSLHDFKNDIGLVKMKDKIICDMYKNPICLPPAGLSIPEGKVLTTAGWGKTETENISQELREGLMKNVNYKKCYIYAGAHLVEGTKYCLVGLEGNWQSTCSGDSGGPTFYKHNGKYTVIGVTSTGSSTCAEGDPVMHTSVPKYVNWIKQVMESSS